MKKYLIIGLLTLGLMFAASPARAEFTMCGVCTVDFISLWESAVATDIPVAPCDLAVTFVFGTQTYKLPVTAFGTQINLALLKAFNAQESFSCCLLVNLLPYFAKIVEIDFPA